MLNNVEGNQPTADETPIIDTSHELKWKRTYRKRLINCLALIENHGRPTTELLYEQRKTHTKNQHLIRKIPVNILLLS